MKAMPLPFEDFQGKGVLNFSSSSSSSSLESPQNWNNNTNTLNTINTTANSNTTTLITKKSSGDKNCYVGSEPTSVLDTRRSPSSPTSSSTLSSSLGGGSNGGGSHSTDTTPTGVAAAAAPVSDTNTTTTTTITTNNNNFSVTTLLEKEEKCGLGMEDWESVLSESPGGQEQSILGLIMADVDDPSLGLNKLLQTSTTTTGVSQSQDMEFNAGFGVVDDQGGYGFEPSPNIIDPCSSSDLPFHNNNTPNVRLAQHSIPTLFSNNLLPVVSLAPVGFPHHHMESVVDTKPEIFNYPPQMVMINQNQAQFSHNPTSALVMPLTYSHLQEHHHVVSPPPAKRINTGVRVGGANFQVQQQQLQLLSHQSRPTTASMGMMKQMNGGGSAAATTTTTSDEQLLVSQQPQPQPHQVVQQAITDQLSKAAELIETGNPVLAQGILARLNHQLFPLGKPFQRAAFYFKEALLLLLQSNNNNPFASSSSSSSPFNLILKIGAYKTFSEISPVLQFANFTCNQAILEATEGFTRVHVIDFDIGYGGQWASFMQELALRNSSSGGVGNRAVSLKITAFASPSTHDEFELGFTQENLKHFASEINLAFELEILSLEMLNSGSWPLNLHVSGNEALAVNLPIGSFSNYPLSLPLVLRFVKQLSPKIVVSLERGCDRTDVPFSLQLVHALHSYSGLLESLDAVNVNLDTMQKIEKCLLQPGIEKIVLGRHKNSMLERMQPPPQPWRSAFLNSGFSPLAFSNFTESQAECLVQRTPVRGFHVEKKQSSSLVLCWQRKDLVSASAWRC